MRRSSLNIPPETPAQKARRAGTDAADAAANLFGPDAIGRRCVEFTVEAGEADRPAFCDGFFDQLRRRCWRARGWGRGGRGRGRK